MSVPKYIQLTANIISGDRVKPAPSMEAANTFSIYKGEPGAFEWIADFGKYNDAWMCAGHLAALLDADLLDDAKAIG